MSSKALGRSLGILLGVAVLLFISFVGLRRASAAEELGTVGIAAVQLYTDAQPNKRGVLMVRRVEPGSAAGNAGIRLGDIIISVNGFAIEGGL
jgi:C-terminal processing protease CtpA/Prc